MSKIKNWLMSMEEYADDLIDQMDKNNLNITQAREKFVAKHGLNQVTILNDRVAYMREIGYL